jgi:uncharacterized metal-binding protein
MTMNKKVGIVACCGEEIAEGTVSRAAARILLEEIRPTETAVVCLPLLIAGGPDEKAFIIHNPTILIDGCEKRCAQKSVLEKGGNPIGTILVSDVLKQHPELKAESRVELGAKGLDLARKVAEQAAAEIDRYMSKQPKQKR